MWIKVWFLLILKLKSRGVQCVGCLAALFHCVLSAVEMGKLSLCRVTQWEGLSQVFLGSWSGRSFDRGERKKSWCNWTGRRVVFTGGERWVNMAVGAGHTVAALTPADSFTWARVPLGSVQQLSERGSSVLYLDSFLCLLSQKMFGLDLFAFYI